jgi:hypothetical protein
MILVDYSGIAIASLFAGGGSSPKKLDEGLIRHLILNTLRSYNVKFRAEYGQMVLVCDSGDTWRKAYFPQYKASRSTSRKKSTVDWTEFYRILNLVRDEIEGNIPFKVVRVANCEADDIIAVLAESTQEFGRGENVMIVSSDCDFLQLQRHGNVRQFSPAKGKLLVSKNPIREIREKILRGDTGDGIPNVLSGDDVFITQGARQTPLLASKVDGWLNNYEGLCESMPADVYRNFIRNQNLIHFSQIPMEIQSKIMDKSNQVVPASKRLTLDYLISKRCSMLISCVSEFFN